MAWKLKSVVVDVKSGVVRRFDYARVGEGGSVVCYRDKVPVEIYPTFRHIAFEYEEV